MPVIDSRNRDKRGRVIVSAATMPTGRVISVVAEKPVQPAAKASDQNDLVYQVVLVKKTPPRKRKNPPAPAPPASEETLKERRTLANPLTWHGYSKDADYSISGLGSTRRYKRYPGKVFAMEAAMWRESPASADRAARDALKAKARENRTASGAVTSL